MVPDPENKSAIESWYDTQSVRWGDSTAVAEFCQNLLAEIRRQNLEGKDVDVAKVVGRAIKRIRVIAVGGTPPSPEVSLNLVVTEVVNQLKMLEELPDDALLALADQIEETRDYIRKRFPVGSEQEDVTPRANLRDQESEQGPDVGEINTQLESFKTELEAKLANPNFDPFATDPDYFTDIHTRFDAFVKTATAFREYATNPQAKVDFKAFNLLPEIETRLQQLRELMANLLERHPNVIVLNEIVAWVQQQGIVLDGLTDPTTILRNGQPVAAGLTRAIGDCQALNLPGIFKPALDRVLMAAQDLENQFDQAGHFYNENKDFAINVKPLLDFLNFNSNVDGSVKIKPTTVAEKNRVLADLTTRREDAKAIGLEVTDTNEPLNQAKKRITGRADTYKLNIEKIAIDLELAEWITGLDAWKSDPANAALKPGLKDLKEKVATYPATSSGWTGDKQKDGDTLRALTGEANKFPRHGLSPEQIEYLTRTYDEPARRLADQITADLAYEGNQLSNPEYQYQLKYKELSALSDTDLVEQAIGGGEKGGARVRIEEHGKIDLQVPVERAFYVVLAEKIFTLPEAKRKENGYGPRDIDPKTGETGDEKFDKWLIAKARLSLRAMSRKCVDSDAARSNVGIWKAKPPNDESELILFALKMDRASLMLATYHHPKIGKIFTELMERLVVQGSLKTGVVAVRNPADGKYYPRKPDARNTRPSEIQSGNTLLPDGEFNYDKLEKQGGNSLYLTPKVEKLVAELLPTYGADLDAHYIKMVKELAITLFCDFNYVDVISSTAQEWTQTPISPRTNLVSSIEAVQNLVNNALHSLLRYKSPRKVQVWFLQMFSLEHSLDTIGPHLDPRGQAVAGYGPEAHEEDIHLLEEVVEKVHNYQNVFYRTSVLERDASPGKLGRLPMPAMGHSMGIPNMHDILMFKAKGDEISREKATAAYDFDKYMQALEMWSKFLDMVVAPMPKKMTLEEVERSSDAGGIIDTMITKVLALAKLVPGSHADMVPLLLYMTTQRILAHFRKRTERTVVLHYLKERFSEACQKGNGLDAFATQMAPFLKMFGVGELDAADRADLTYLDHQYHKDFAPVDDDTMEKRVEEVTIAEWNEKHPGQPHPPIIGHARPPWAAGINEVTGYITEDMLEFWAAIENNDPPTPADRKGGIKDDAKQK